jgi:crotonobetainyl-CoA:carnitine CoA-transferase CaiB-like acyl-CoA transferase
VSWELVGELFQAQVAVERLHPGAALAVYHRSLIEWDHPTGGRLRQPRPGARFGGTPVEPRFNVPGLGEHTDEVLDEPRSS